MPQITAITEQKANSKRQAANKDKRFNIFLDSKYAFSVGEEQLIKFKFNVGQTLSPEQIKSTKSEESEIKLKDQAINFLSYRPRSEKEIRDYIIKKISTSEKIKWQEAKSTPIADLIINKLKKYGLVNDQEFAKWWINSRTKTRPKGRILIKTELLQKGIDRNLIDKLLPKNAKTDLNLALRIVEIKKNRLKNLTIQEARKKIYYLLSSRGFDFDTLKEAFAIYAKKR